MPSFRTFLLLVAGFLPTTVAIGQVKLSPAFEKDAQETVEDDNEYQITVFPQASPDPKLRYRLWPAAEDRVAKPVMVAVNRSLLMIAQVPAAQKRAFLDAYDRLESLPIRDIPVEEATKVCQPFDVAIGVFRSGENWMITEYDLGLREMSPHDKVATLLPEFQEMRDLARLLCIRARIAAAEGRWDDAVDDLRLGFRLGEAASHGTDTVLGRLIGMAIARVMLDTAEAMIEVPNCPNLYWALAALPIDHLFETRRAIEYETTLLTHIGSIAGQTKLPDEILGEDEASARLKTIVDAYATDFGDFTDGLPPSWMRRLSTGAMISMMVSPSRKMLAETPLWRDRVSKLSDAEAVLRASDLELSRARENWLAWSSLPIEYWDEYEEQRTALIRDINNPRTFGGALARITLPSIDRVAIQERSSKQRHHRLLTLEALRMHAAATGRLPDSLDEVRPTPAWKDPVSQQPFGYECLSPNRAILRKAESAGINNDRLATEITLGESK